LKRLTIFVLLIIACAGCSGALTATVTPPPAAQVFTPPSPPVFPTSPSCSDLARAEQIARDFIARYNAADLDGTLALVSENARNYIDAAGRFSVSSGVRVALRAHLEKQFRSADKFEISDVKAQVDPSNTPPLYAVTMNVARTTGTDKSTSMIQMAIECATGQLIIVAVIPN
jgi:hypothetical protein